MKWSNINIYFAIVRFLTILLLAGCNEDEPVAPTPVQVLSNTTFTKTVSIGNIEREYVLYVPEG